jgi:hypothetical protein
VRLHDRFSRLAPFINAERVSDVVTADRLVAARLDPGFSLRYEGLLDLVFERDGTVVLIPFLVIQGAMLLARESSPFIWPSWLPPLRAAAARAIEDRLEPWLRSLTVARFHDAQMLRSFDDRAGVRGLLEDARGSDFLCAAPIESALSQVSPYVYALRFAGRRIAIVDENGAYGASLLTRAGAIVDADLQDPQRAALARHWYDLDVFNGVAGETYDLVIAPRAVALDAPVRIFLDDEALPDERRVDVVGAIPPSVMVSFDLDDGRPAGRFAVRAPALPRRSRSVAEPAIVGGSSGRIAIVVRDDFERTPDADTDAAFALAARLREQGFSPAVLPPDRASVAGFDLLHVFGHRFGSGLRAVLAQTQARGLPIVLSPYADDPADEAPWGVAASSVLLRFACDAGSRDYYARAVALRRFEAPGVPAPARAKEEADPNVRALFAAAGGAIVSCAEEERRIREAFGFTGATQVVPALLGPGPQAAEIADLVGTDEYVLVHAPLDPRCNQLPIARACAGAKLPLVLVGSVTNAEYYGEVIAALGSRGVWLAEGSLSEAQIDALYSRARVFADASWSAAGLHRLARAAAFGASLAAPSSGYARSVWTGLVQSVDPAGGAAIAAGIAAAWENAPRNGPATAARTAEACDPWKALVAVLAVYQTTAGPPVAGGV